MIDAVGGHDAIRVHEVDVRTVGEAAAPAGVARTRFQPMCGILSARIASGARRVTVPRRMPRPAQSPSSLCSNRTCRPRQMPRYGVPARDPLAQHVAEAALGEPAHEHAERALARARRACPLCGRRRDRA